MDEPLREPNALVVFELEAYPEPKSLDQADLRALYARYGSFHRVAKHIGSSEAFARLNAKSTPRNPKKRLPASKS